MTVIETRNLDFSFNKSEKVLQGLNLKVGKGSVYGFLGPNGSGKTTTIRLLLGLLANPGSNISLFGKHLSEDREGLFARIGSLIEQPSLYEHLSGFENLEIARRLRGTARGRVSEVLALTGLADAARKKAGAYSLGMKQRLGLAIALLGSPELLILDEPVNGLDPSGIMEIRELLLRLNRENGVTIFLSSHLLPEIEKLVTHLGVISKGKLVYQGDYPGLNEMMGRSSAVYVETSDNIKAAETLGKMCRIIPGGDNYLDIIYEDRNQIAAICRLLVEAGIDIYRIEIQKQDLENIFLEITNN